LVTSTAVLPNEEDSSFFMISILQIHPIRVFSDVA
jgi:hypothetical protein